MENPIKLHLWADGDSTNFKRLSEKFQTLNNSSLTATVKSLLPEVYGDSILCQDICHRYSTIINSREQTAKATAMENATISSRQVKEHYSLPPDNPSFIKFRNMVNDKCMEIIQSTYGQFNTITDPLLSFTNVSNPPSYQFLHQHKHLLIPISFQIDEFAVVLKRDLQPHYEVLAELLGKQDKEKMDADKGQRWDRQIFYVFCALIRIRYPKYFD